MFNFFNIISNFKRGFSDSIDYIEHKFLLYSRLQEKDNKITELNKEIEILNQKLSLFVNKQIINVDLSDEFLVHLIIISLLTIICFKIIKIYISKHFKWLYDYQIISFFFKSDIEKIKDEIMKIKIKGEEELKANNDLLLEHKAINVEEEFLKIKQDIERNNKINKEFIQTHLDLKNRFIQENQENLIFYKNIIDNFNKFTFLIYQKMNKRICDLEKCLLNIKNNFEIYEVNANSIIEILNNIKIDYKFITIVPLLYKKKISELQKDFEKNWYLEEEEFKRHYFGWFCSLKNEKDLSDNDFIPNLAFFLGYYIIKQDNRANTDLDVLKNNLLEAEQTILKTITCEINANGGINDYNNLIKQLSNLKEGDHEELSNFLKKFTYEGEQIFDYEEKVCYSTDPLMIGFSN